MKYKIVILFLSLLIAGCSTVHQTATDSNKAIKMPVRNAILKNLALKASVSAALGSQSLMASAKMDISGTDSITLSLFTFGLQVGKMYADEDLMYFYNTLTNQVLEGTPNGENMKSAMMVPLSYNDFVHLVRSETPGKPEDFKYQSKLNEDEFLFKNDANPAFIEYAVISTTDNTLTQYQRKLSDGTLLLHVFYSEYQKTDGVNYPMKQLYKFPEIDANLNIEVSDISINPVFERPFKFRVPENVQRVNLNAR